MPRAASSARIASWLQQLAASTRPSALLPDRQARPEAFLCLSGRPDGLADPPELVPGNRLTLWLPQETVEFGHRGITAPGRLEVAPAEQELTIPFQHQDPAAQVASPLGDPQGLAVERRRAGIIPFGSKQPTEVSHEVAATSDQLGILGPPLAPFLDDLERDGHPVERLIGAAEPLQAASEPVERRWHRPESGGR